MRLMYGKMMYVYIINVNFTFIKHYNDSLISNFWEQKMRTNIINRYNH